MRDHIEDFAKAILRAQQIRKESWVDDGHCLDRYEAADKAASELGFDERVTQPIYLLNLLAWNDIRTWAEKITKGTTEDET